MLRFLSKDDHKIMRKGLRQILPGRFSKPCIDEMINTFKKIQMTFKFYAAVLLIIFFAANPYSVKCQKLITYPAPVADTDSMHNKDFSVQVRKPGGKWQDLFEYNVKVDEVKNTKHHVENASMCSFDFSGEVEVAVTSNRAVVRKVKIRPLSYDVKHEVKGNTVYFRLLQPRNL